MLTVEQVRMLPTGTVLYHSKSRNEDGSPTRWRIAGRPLWKRTRPGEIRVPVKRGAFEKGYINEKLLTAFCLSEEEAINHDESDPS